MPGIRAAACVLLAWPALSAMGCAHSQPATTPTQVDALQTRLEEVERTNGRLTVRIEELERQLMLVQDRTEANRLAMQRRGMLRDDEPVAVAPQEAQPPQPAPESYYGKDSGYSADPSLDQRMARRPVSRIALSDEQSGALDGPPPQDYAAVMIDVEDPGDDGEEVVITDDDFRRFAGLDAAPRPQAPAAASGSRTAQPPVTTERLATSNELARREPAKEARPATSARSGDDSLSIYQDSLAEYRTGNYARALEGFQAFLADNPRPDYIDNALYWIGECHYGLGDYSAAVTQFQRILDEIPNGSKVPDAMLKMSLAFDRMGRGSDSVELLEKLTRQYPTTNPGRLGARRLAEHPDRN